MIQADNGQWPAAVDLFESALHGRSDLYRRGALNDAAHLVNALAQVGSWKRGEHVLEERVLPAAKQVCSGRTRTLLLSLRTDPGPQPMPPALRELVIRSCAA